jgi:CubicO group peptidase (beta-lactamase class C family)
VVGRIYAPASIAEQMRLYEVPALSIAIINDSKIEWAAAYGLADVESGRSATSSSLFQAASISKPISVTAALQIVQEKKLSLDEDVNLKLRSWKVPSNDFMATKPVTLRGIITHSAGLTVTGFPGYRAGTSIPSLVQILNGEKPANTVPVKVDIEPGTRSRYSGGGTTVMQLLLTDVTETPFPQLMQERVLGLVGMKSSTYEQPLPEHRVAEAVTGYRPHGQPVEGRYHTYPEMAAAGLWTTPTDLAKRVIEIQRSFAGTSQKVLSQKTTQQMLTPNLGGWGLGPALSDEGDSLRFGHTGGNEGFSAEVVGFALRGQGAAVMTNSDTGAALIAEVLAAVAREYKWPGYAPKVIVPIALASQSLREYAGRYLLKSGQDVTIELENEALWITTPVGRSEMVPTGTDTFALAARAAPQARSNAATTVSSQGFPWTGSSYNGWSDTRALTIPSPPPPPNNTTKQHHQTRHHQTRHRRFATKQDTDVSPPNKTQTFRKRPPESAAISQV